MLKYSGSVSNGRFLCRSACKTATDYTYFQEGKKKKGNKHRIEKCHRI